jgi:DnaJ domain
MKAVSKASILRKTLILLLCVAPCWINAGCLKNDDLHDLGINDIAILQDTVIQLCHEILGIERNVSSDEIEEAHKKLRNKYHPDKNQGNEVAATEVFTALDEAYDLLGTYLTKENVPAIANLVQYYEGVKQRLERALKLKQRLEYELKFKQSRPTPPRSPKKDNVVDGTTPTTINDID